MKKQTTIVVISSLRVKVTQNDNKAVLLGDKLLCTKESINWAEEINTGLFNKTNFSV